MISSYNNCNVTFAGDYPPVIKYDELMWQQRDLASRDGESGAHWVNKVCVCHINTLIHISAQTGMKKGAFLGWFL